MDDDLRVAPKNWREYLQGTAKTVDVIRWVWRDVVSRQCHKWMKLYFLFMVVLTFAQISQAWAASHIFNGLINHEYGLVKFGFCGFVVCLASYSLATWQMSRAREWVLGLNMGALDHHVTAKFFEKSMGQHVQEGSVLNVSNIDKGRWLTLQLTDMLLFNGVSVVCMLFIAWLFLWCLSWVTGLAVTIVIAVHVVWSLFLNCRASQVCKPIEKEFRGLNRHRVERWDKMERVKTCGKEEPELQEMDSWWDRIITADRKFWLWLIGHASLRGIVNMTGVVLVMVYGAWMVWEGKWQVGTLYPLYFWTSLLSGNLWQLGHIEHQLNWNMPPINSMMEAVTLEPDVVSLPNAHVISPQEPITVVFENVSYSYPRGSSEEGHKGEKSLVPVIQDVSFTIGAGEKVALLGESGAGKTTLMRLVLRFTDPDQGRILVNGCDLREINLTSWMRTVGYIPQQAHVLDGTIRYNLTYGLSQQEQALVTDEQLWELMRLLRIDFGARLTDGLDTRVGRNGMKLSGGQAQRLMIGAAVVKKPRFMIIDEATSNLDSTTEKEVQTGLSVVLSSDVSALVIAHRLSTVRQLCDRFIVVQEAASLENGTPQIEAVAASFEALYGISPTFRRLADDQGVLVTPEFQDGVMAEA